MKKTLIAAAALSALAAQAQSNVTVYGILDATLGIGNGNVSSATILTNSAVDGTRLGFRGTEDLGGGMKANFMLEGTVNTDDGSGRGTNTNNQAAGGGSVVGIAGQQGFTFNRHSWVGLSGGFGEVRLGRQYVPHFWAHVFYDPFTIGGAGTSIAFLKRTGGVASVNASNAIGYKTNPIGGGFTVEFMTYLGENASNVADAGSGNSLRLAYVAGPLNAGLGWGKTTTGAGSDTTTTNIGASYDMGVAKIMGLWNKDDVATAAGTTSQTGWTLGATIPAGPGFAKVSFGSSETSAAGNAKVTQFAVGYQYPLSKRTFVQVGLAQVNNSNGEVGNGKFGSGIGANGSGTGFDIGLRHGF
jgi:predicted porin